MGTFIFSEESKQSNDVELMMREIRTDIRESGYTERERRRAKSLASRDRSDGETGGYEPAAIKERLSSMRATANNPVFFPFKGNPLKAGLQRLIQKIVGSSFYRAFLHQNRYNADVLAVMLQLQSRGDELEEELREQQSRNDELEAELKELRKALEERTCGN